VAGVSYTDGALTVTLMGGRAITVPLAWYQRLLHVTSQQRLN
jgi:hypothetical protein